MNFLKKHIMSITLILGVILDQLSKVIIQNNFKLHEVLSIIPGFFDLTYAQNTGAAWSILEGKMWFFYVISIVALIVLIGFYKASNSALTKFGIVLAISGTIGNLIDRILFQYVRDFLSFNIFGYAFPIFNIADSLLVIGILIIIFDELFGVYLYGRKNVNCR